MNKPLAKVFLRCVRCGESDIRYLYVWRPFPAKSCEMCEKGGYQGDMCLESIWTASESSPALGPVLPSATYKS